MREQQTPSWLQSMPPKLKLPRYVERSVAKGRAYYRVRYKGTRICTLPNDPSSPEFHEAYAAALRKIAEDPAPRAHTGGSVGWLIASYKASPYFTSKVAQTRRSYEREMGRLQSIEAFPAVDVRRRHINAIRDKLAATPRTRQLFGQVCSLLFSYGIRELDLEMMNPAQLMTRDGDPDSYLAWSAEQMQVFEQSAPPCHVLTAYMIGRYTGPRRGDIVGLKRNHYDGAGLTIAGSKTKNEIYVPAHPALKAYLDALPDTLTIVADSIGRPVTPDRVTKDMRKHLDKIKLFDLHLHGLRHTAGTALAEAGCSPHEIKAVLGHATLQMVERYTKRARQKAMATAAILKLGRNRDET